MDERLKRLLQKDMEKEADHMMEVLDSQPDKDQDYIPQDVYQDVFAKLKEFTATEAKLEAERKAGAKLDAEGKAEAEVKDATQLAGDNSRLSSEEQELIRLGSIYKKRRKWNRLAILVAALVCVLSLGLTATGGPDKLFEEIRWKLAGREQTNIDSDDDRVVQPDDVSEDEAYEKIDEVFGFYPVKLYYLPEGIAFSEFEIDEVLQSAQVIYKENEDKLISYLIRPNYRTSSMTTDVEENKVDEYQDTKNDVLLNIKEYYEPEEKMTRWSVEFKYHNTQYSLLIMGVEEIEMKKIVENLYFS